jgi:zinc transport system ATP-binding protein
MPVGAETAGAAGSAPPHETEPLLSTRNLTVKSGERVILEHVDMTVGEGEIVTIIGPNGSGKTTLIRSVLGLLAPSSGTIRRSSGLKIGYMPQRLHIDRTLPLPVSRFVTLGSRATKRAVKRTLEETGIDHLASASCHDLSGGEFRRVMLARALMSNPRLLVLDEPTANIDVTGQADFYRLIGRIRKEHGCGILMVSHDLHLVMAATDHVICLNGHVCCSGEPEQVSRHPEYVALFGRQATSQLAVYVHQHDHAHDLHGHAVSQDDPANGRREAGRDA